MEWFHLVLFRFLFSLMGWFDFHEVKLYQHTNVSFINYWGLLNLHDSRNITNWKEPRYASVVPSLPIRTNFSIESPTDIKTNFNYLN